MDLATRHLGPPRRGLEIGASAVNPFPGLRAWNLDYPAGELFQAAQEHLPGGPVPVHVYGLGAPLPLRSSSVDYVLTSHVLEHMPDTITALGEWDRVVVDGGTIFLIVPHKQRTFDAPRPRTELAHHLADHALGMTIEASPMAPTSHYHVWITEDVLALIAHLNQVGFLDWALLAVEDVDSKVGNGFTIVARKRSRPKPRPAPTGDEVAFFFLTLELPFQVPGRTLEYVVQGPEFAAPADLPRGRYRAVPILAGFPPRAGTAFTVEHGPAAEVPVIDSVQRHDALLVFRGQHLAATTWLEIGLPDGRRAQLLPELEDGALTVDTTGLVVPPVPVAVTPVNPPPGGGRGPTHELRAHLPD